MATIRTSQCFPAYGETSRVKRTATAPFHGPAQGGQTGRRRSDNNPLRRRRAWFASPRAAPTARSGSNTIPVATTASGATRPTGRKPQVTFVFPNPPGSPIGTIPGAYFHTEEATKATYEFLRSATSMASGAHSQIPGSVRYTAAQAPRHTPFIGQPEPEHCGGHSAAGGDHCGRRQRRVGLYEQVRSRSPVGSPHTPVVRRPSQRQEGDDEATVGGERGRVQRSHKPLLDMPRLFSLLSRSTGTSHSQLTKH